MASAPVPKKKRNSNGGGQSASLKKSKTIEDYAMPTWVPQVKLAVDTLRSWMSVPQRGCVSIIGGFVRRWFFSITLNVSTGKRRWSPILASVRTSMRNLARRTEPSCFHLDSLNDCRLNKEYLIFISCWRTSSRSSSAGWRFTFPQMIQS